MSTFSTSLIIYYVLFNALVLYAFTSIYIIYIYIYIYITSVCFGGTGAVQIQYLLIQSFNFLLMNSTGLKVKYFKHTAIAPNSSLFMQRYEVICKI